MNQFILKCLWLCHDILSHRQTYTLLFKLCTELLLFSYRRGKQMLKRACVCLNQSQLSVGNVCRLNLCREKKNKTSRPNVNFISLTGSIRWKAMSVKYSWIKKYMQKEVSRVQRVNGGGNLPKETRNPSGLLGSWRNRFGIGLQD